MKTEEDIEVVRSVCWGGGGCEGPGCGILLYVKHGKLMKVEGDSECPVNQGRACIKALSLPRLVHHPDRLKHPLKRVGKRGEGKWEPISWDEAYDIIAKKLNEIKEKYGPESVVFAQGTGRDIMCWISRLAYSYGSPNWFFAFLAGQACYIPRIAAILVMIGETTELDASQYFPDRYENPQWKPPKCAVIWGKNPVISSPDDFFGSWLIECMKGGTKLIVVDPRLTWLASRAEHWLQIRPGTDAALALGWLNVIISEELYDKEFVEKWCYGFDKLRERVQRYPPEKVAAITWVPKEKIVEAARFYARSKPAAIQWGTCFDHSNPQCGFYGAMGITALTAITGNVDVPGGNVIQRSPFGITQPWFGAWGYDELLTDEQKGKRLGLKEYPLYNYGFLTASPEIVQDAIFTGEPYPIKAAWIQTNNPIACMSAGTKTAYEALKKLDFIVVVDLFMTPTAVALADIVLPAGSTAERDSIRCVFQSVSPVVKALKIGEAKGDPEICFELGKRLNPEAWPWENLEEMLDAILKPAGLTFKDLKEKKYVYPIYEYRKHEKGYLRQDGKLGFNTPTGKVELYSTLLEKFGYDPLPYYEEPPETPLSAPEVYKEYPLILISGARSWTSFHSEHRQIPWLREIKSGPIVELHPDTAKELGIEEGDMVWIESRRGKCKQRAKLFSGIHPKVVHADHGWWYPEKPGPEPSFFGVWESNINLLTEMGCGTHGFGSNYEAILCRVYKAE